MSGVAIVRLELARSPHHGLSLASAGNETKARGMRSPIRGGFQNLSFRPAHALKEPNVPCPSRPKKFLFCSRRGYRAGGIGKWNFEHGFDQIGGTHRDRSLTSGSRRNNRNRPRLCENSVTREFGDPLLGLSASPRFDVGVVAEVS